MIETVDALRGRVVVSFKPGARSSLLTRKRRAEPDVCKLIKTRPTQYQTRRSTIIFLISPIAFAGFRPLGQVWAQFMMVWQR